MDLEDLEGLAMVAAFDGVIECPECGNVIEPDCEECPCGWKNPLTALGFV